MVDRRSEYLKRKNTPTPFNQGPEMQNYNRMMELQSQAPNFTKNDPRLNELKDARRQYNRFDKYKIGERQGVSPLDVQRQFSDQRNVFRKAAPNVYGTMYPFADLAMKYGESGGLLGMAAKEMFGKVSDFGKDMSNKVGITGAADADEAEMQDYAAQTFGMGAPMDRHPGSTPVIEGPGKSTVLPNIHTGEIYYDRGEGLDFEDDPNQPYVAPDNYVEKDFGDFYIDADTLAPERGLPFDDSVRERAIMERYPESFIGPPIDPSWRPDMYDVTGPRLIDRGLFPYPNYNDEVTLAPPPFYGGRGEMPGMDSPYYNDMMEGIERGVREKELQDALEADQGRSLITIPPDFDPDRKEFTNTEDYYEWIRDMRKYGYR